MPQHLRIVTTGEGVCIITLNRPEKLNAVNPALADEFPEAMRDAASSRCVLITGAGRGFCAGLELTPSVLATPIPEDDELGWVGRWALAVSNCPVPVIAAVNGPAVGAGFALTLAADIRLVSDAATMSCGYARIGLSPDAGVTYFLPRLIGTSRATEWIYTARDILPAEALSTGLAAAVYPAAEFAEASLAYATRVAQGPTVAVRQTKHLLAGPDLESQLRRELAAIRQCFATEDLREAVTAFAEKRKPKFAGR